MEKNETKASLNFDSLNVVVSLKKGVYMWFSI